MENLNIRFGMIAEDRKEIAEDNLYDYFEKLFGIAPLDYSLLELPIGSPCGSSCKDAIDWIHALYHNPRFVHAWRMACSHIDAAHPADLRALNEHHWAGAQLTKDAIAAIAFNAIEIYWRG